MSPEKEQLLYERYPLIFANRNREGMFWYGIECGDGWFNIIDRLCNNIQKHINNLNRHEELVEQVVVDQIKEKFAGLRFYCEGGDSAIYGMIDMAESMSEVTCEECGAPGTVYGKGWFRVHCEQHRRE